MKKYNYKNYTKFQLLYIFFKNNDLYGQFKQIYQYEKDWIDDKCSNNEQPFFSYMYSLLTKMFAYNLIQRSSKNTLYVKWYCFLLYEVEGFSPTVDQMILNCRYCID